MGDDLKERIEDRIEDNIEGNVENNVIELQDLKNDVINPYKDIFRNLNLGYRTSNLSERWVNFIDKLNEKLQENSDSLEWALLGNPQVQALLSNILDTQENFLIKERNRCIVKEKNRELEVWDSDFQSYEGFNIDRLSPEEFERFLLSDKWICFIKEHIQNHINRETGEIYHNYPVSEDAFRLDLKNAYDAEGFIQHYSAVPTYEMVKDYPRIIYDLVENKFNNLVWEYTKNWRKNFDTELINDLEWIINEIESSFLYVWDDESEERKDNIEKWRKDLFKIFLEERINNNYTYLVYKDGEISLETWNDQIDLQLKSYLYVYSKIFFPKLLINNGKKWYNNELTEVLKVILLDYNPELEAQIKNRELLEQKKKQEQEMKEREIRRRQEAEKRNRERNSHLNRNANKSFQDQDYDKKKDDNSWVKLVENSNLNLSDFSVWWEDSESISESAQTKYWAFRLAWNKFIEYNDNIKNIITYEDMIKLYDMGAHNIDEVARISFLETDIMKWRSDGEINRIYETLQLFTNYFNDAIKGITSKIIGGKEKMDDKIKMYALWAVIDNVKNVFDSIVSKWQWESKFEWFSFDSHEPVKRQWNDIIISWKFNWADIKIRYDLISGWLFMNSFIQHLSPSKVTIWNNTDANYKIGQLKSFDTILDEHYNSPKLPNNKPDLWNNWNRKFSNQNHWWLDWWEWDKHDKDLKMIGDKPNEENGPDNTPVQSSNLIKSQPMMSKNEIESLKQRFWDMLNANVDLIWGTVVNYTKKQSTRNSVIIKFMKTFNIVLDEENMKNIDVSNESNMFDFIQIIENSDSSSLESFQLFMEKIMGYSGLNRWNNNLQWSQKNQKSDLTLDENNDNKYASLLRNWSRDFFDNLENLKWKLNFDSNSQLWFIKMISEHITNGIEKPNRSLDISKMNDFIYHLENDNRETT